MPGSIAQPTPTLVMPQTLCTLFEESRNYELQENMFHDGSRQAYQYALNSRRTFKQSKRLTSTQLSTLWAFYNSVDGGLEPFIFYNPYEGTPIGSNYDASGSSTVGRYVVCFRNNWNQSTVSTRTVVENLEIVQLAPMSAQYQALTNFGEHGTILSASVSVIASWTAGDSGIGTPGIDLVFGQMNLQQVMFGNSQGIDITGISSTPQTFTTNLATENLANLSQVSVASYIFGTLYGGGTVPDVLRVYDISITVNYADLTSQVFKPISTRSASGNAGGIFGIGTSGVAANEASVIDNSTTTAGTISRLFYNGFADCGYIQALF